jgi:hypothetical protein
MLRPAVRHNGQPGAPFCCMERDSNERVTTEAQRHVGAVYDRVFAGIDEIHAVTDRG